MKTLSWLTTAILLLFGISCEDSSKSKSLIFNDSKFPLKEVDKNSDNSSLILIKVIETNESGNTFIDLSNNNISDLSLLKALKKDIESVYLGDNYIEDLKPLSHLTKVKDLRLAKNYICDLGPLSNLTNLTRLCLEENKINDITPLKDLKNLKELRAWENRITDLTPLTNLYRLKELYLNKNKIKDITQLSGLLNLKKLSLWGNNISDITPLKKLSNLIELELSHNNIPEDQKLILEAALPNTKISW